MANTTGNREFAVCLKGEFAVCLKVCRVLIIEHTANQKHTAKTKFVVCSWAGTRRSHSSPCATATTHGEAGSTRADVNGRGLQLNAVNLRRVPEASTR